MISEELQKIIDKINKLGEMHYLKGVVEEQIVDFEKKYGIKLPKKYREWLLFSDGGELFLPAGIQLYGIAHKPIINIKNNDKPDDSYIVLGALASGDPIVFKKAEERVSIYNHETGRIENDETYEDFYTFLKDTYDMLGMGD